MTDDDAEIHQLLGEERGANRILRDFMNTHEGTKDFKDFEPEMDRAIKIAHNYLYPGQEFTQQKRDELLPILLPAAFCEWKSWNKAWEFGNAAGRKAGPGRVFHEGIQQVKDLIESPVHVEAIRDAGGKLIGARRKKMAPTLQ